MPLLLLLTALFTAYLPPETSVEWLSQTEHDFGEIDYNTPVTHFFEYRNTTGSPIVIDNVRPGCGCTAPEWSVVPLEPDSTAALKVVYDARKVGYFRVPIKVYFSSQRKAEQLYIEGEVVDRSKPSVDN